jgi:hypothetical protein
MSTDQNKAVVRRFITEVLVGGNLDLLDELLGPNYVNRAMGTDLAAFTTAITGLAAAIPDRSPPSRRGHGPAERRRVVALPCPPRGARGMRRGIRWPSQESCSLDRNLCDLGQNTRGNGTANAHYFLVVLRRALLCRPSW